MDKTKLNILHSFRTNPYLSQGNILGYRVVWQVSDNPCSSHWPPSGQSRWRGPRSPCLGQSPGVLSHWPQARCKSSHFLLLSNLRINIDRGMTTKSKWSFFYWLTYLCVILLCKYFLITMGQKPLNNIKLFKVHSHLPSTFTLWGTTSNRTTL